MDIKIQKYALREAIRKNVLKKDKKQLREIDAKNKQGHSYTLYINESGLRRLMNKTRHKKIVQKFSDWIIRDILPSAIKYKSYKLIGEHKNELSDILNKIVYLEEENNKFKKDQYESKSTTKGIIYVINYGEENEPLYKINMTQNTKTIKCICDTKTFNEYPVIYIIKSNTPLQLIIYMRVLLYKYRYYSDKKNIFECKLSTIKNAFDICTKNIIELNEKKCGSKTNKTQYNRNLIDKKLVTLRKEEYHIRDTIINLQKEIGLI